MSDLHLFLGYNDIESLNILENLIDKYGTFNVISEDDFDRELYDDDYAEALLDRELVEEYINFANTKINNRELELNYVPLSKNLYLGRDDNCFYLSLLDLDYSADQCSENFEEIDLEKCLPIMDRAKKEYDIKPGVQWIVS